jgi:hypothetical protein
MRGEPFDEINGLQFEERIKLTQESFNRIMKEIKQLGIMEGTEIQELFLLKSLEEWNEIVKRGAYSGIRKIQKMKNKLKLSEKGRSYGQKIKYWEV